MAKTTINANFNGLLVYLFIRLFLFRAFILPIKYGLIPNF